jgi:hypothetical protein
MTYEECLTYIKQYRIQIVKELDALEEIEENTPGYVFQERVIQDFRNLIKDMAEELRKNEDYSKPEELKIRISINHKVNGKLKSEDKQGFINFTTCFQQEILSPNQILEEIKSGWAYSPAWFRDRRSNANFVLSELVSIDIDNGLRLESALSNNFIKENALLIHTTSSHTEENNRFRILFHLPKLIDNVEEYRVWVINLMKYLEFADPSCKDVCRGFYGAKDCQTFLFNKTISEEVFLDISKKFREEDERLKAIELNKQKTERNKVSFPEDKDRNYKIACSILDNLPNKIEYDEWFKILCVLKNEFGDATAQIMCSSKWTGEEYKEIPYKMKTINRDELSFGTLVHIAQQYGWNISDMV